MASFLTKHTKTNFIIKFLLLNGRHIFNFGCNIDLLSECIFYASIIMSLAFSVSFKITSGSACVV